MVVEKCLGYVRMAEAMEVLRHHLNKLSTASPEATFGFLRPAFVLAVQDERTELARHLLQTRLPEAIRLVLSQLDQLELTDDDLQALPALALHEALTKALEEADHDECTNALYCIRRRCIAQDAHLFVRVPPRRDRDLAAYGMALQSLVIDAMNRDPSGALNGPDRTALERATVALMKTHHGHRMGSVRLAGALLAHRAGPVLKEEINKRDSIVGPAVRHLDDLIDEPIVQRMLVRWLNSPLLGPTIARRLGDYLSSGASFDCVFSQPELMRSPQRRAALRQVIRPLRIIRHSSRPQGGQCAAAVVELLLTLPFSTSTRIAQLQSFIQSSHGAAQMKAMLALDAHGQWASVPDGISLSTDAGRRVHRVISWRRSSAPLRHINSSQRSPLDRVALIRRAMTGANEFWNVRPNLPEAVQRVTALTLLERDRAELIAGAREALAASPAQTSLSVIQLVQRLNIQRDVELELMALAGSSNEHVVAAAVRALAISDAPSRESVVRAAMTRATGRVRANAIAVGKDSLTSREQSEAETDSRSRINMILVNQASCDELLAGALRDPRASHRRSAIWGAARRGARQCLDELKRLAKNDPEPLLRQRARSAARLVELRTHAALSGRAVHQVEVNG